MLDEIDCRTLESISRESHSTVVLERLEKYESNPTDRGLHDEEVWTRLFAYGFAAVEGGLAQLTRQRGRVLVGRNP
jgi:hypothetical protein